MKSGPIISILNFPWTLLGLAVGLLSVPKGAKFSKTYFVINVRRLWLNEIYMRRRVRGVTVGSTILLSDSADKFTLDHELVHLKQFQKYPFIFPILYLFELLKNGYGNNKYEEEAYQLTESNTPA